MHAIWGSSEENKKLFKRSKAFRETLKGIVSKRFQESFSSKDYDTPSWSHKQAHINGYNQAIKEMLELIKE